MPVLVGRASHSVSHPDLTQLHGGRLRRQLRESRRRLEDPFDVQVDFLGYPGGIYTHRVKLAVRRAGYLAATGTRSAPPRRTCSPCPESTATAVSPCASSGSGCGRTRRRPRAAEPPRYRPLTRARAWSARRTGPLEASAQTPL